MTKPALQRARLLAQIGFFTLFTVTPIFDLFRYDLTERHAYFLTMPWHLGIDELIAGTGDAKTAAINIILFLFLPVLGTLGLIIGTRTGPRQLQPSAPTVAGCARTFRWSKPSTG